MPFLRYVSTFNISYSLIPILKYTLTFSKQVGACIVNKKNVIVGVGYNGMPRGCSDDKFPWGSQKYNQYNSKFVYGKHVFDIFRVWRLS